MRRPAIALAVAVALLAPSVLAQDNSEPRREDFAAWAKERIATLEGELAELKAKVAELAAEAKPAAERARERFEAERPALEEAGETFWAKVKEAAAALRDELRAFFERDAPQDGEQRAAR